MRTTYQNLLESRIPAAVGLCADDRTGKLLKWVNEACHILLLRGLYWGTTGKYSLCATSNCITLPPQMATIEKINVQHAPVMLRNIWFQFIQNGPGSSGCSTFNAQFIGSFPTFDTIDRTGKQITWIVDVAQDAGNVAVFLGYDENKNWIRTEQDGELKDGVALVGAQSPGSESSIVFSSITDVRLPDMSGQSWLYQSDAGTLEKLVGHYQYFERNPSYRRYKVPSIKCCADCRTLIEVVAKHEFIPVRVPTDYLPIGNLPALKWMVMAVKKYEEAENGAGILEADGFRDRAVQLLDQELAHYQGTSTDDVPNIVGFSVGSNQPVENLL